MHKRFRISAAPPSGQEFVVRAPPTPPAASPATGSAEETYSKPRSSLPSLLRFIENLSDLSDVSRRSAFFRQCPHHQLSSGPPKHAIDHVANNLPLHIRLLRCRPVDMSALALIAL